MSSIGDACEGSGLFIDQKRCAHSSLLPSSGPLQVSAPSSAATLVPRLLRAAVALLDEGGLEARTAGKRMLWMLRAQLDGGSGGGGDDFKRSLAKLDCKTDKASRSAASELPILCMCAAAVADGAAHSTSDAWSMPGPSSLAGLGRV